MCWNWNIKKLKSIYGTIKFIYFNLIVKFHWNKIKLIIKITLLLTKHKTAWYWTLMDHFGHHTHLPYGQWTSKFQSNHPSTLVTHLHFSHIKINLFSKTFNENEPIYSNLIVILMINLRLDVIINTQLLYFYFEKCLSLFMGRDQLS